jgi:hypothetical protein
LTTTDPPNGSFVPRRWRMQCSPRTSVARPSR